MRNLSKVWFDRFNRYRLAAVLLAIPTAWVLISDQNFVGSHLELAVRVTYRVGLVILLVAIAMDSWTVYSGKRKVKRMIEDRSRSID